MGGEKRYSLTRRYHRQYTPPFIYIIQFHIHSSFLIFDKFLSTGIFLYSPFHTLLYTPLHSSAFIYTSLHSSTLLYTSLHSSALPYTSLHSSSLLCTSLHFPTLLYTHLHSSTLLYTHLHSSTLLYTPLYSFTLLYTVFTPPVKVSLKCYEINTCQVKKFCL